MRQNYTYERATDALGDDLGALLVEVGVDMFLPTPTPTRINPNPVPPPPIRITIVDNPADINREYRIEGESPEQHPFVFIMAAVDFAKVGKGDIVTVGGIRYAIGSPAHPQYYMNAPLYKAVAAYALG